MSSAIIAVIFKLSFIDITVNGTCVPAEKSCLQNGVCNKNNKCQCKVGYTYKNKSCRYSGKSTEEHIQMAIWPRYCQLGQVIPSNTFLNIWSVRKRI